ncbi:hypothetical protein T492DRAFT_837089 [Pavlovales sp. CCMP2436]|nr:hypothetical protein T492DRAFT_837089 [Pavlovales sp. CCMP2436]
MEAWHTRGTTCCYMCKSWHNLGKGRDIKISFTKFEFLGLLLRRELQEILQKLGLLGVRFMASFKMGAYVTEVDGIWCKNPYWCRNSSWSGTGPVRVGHWRAINGDGGCWGLV